jgi:exodeoxyribonuclease III
MKIATFNINDVNKRLPNLLDWLHAAKPDVVCLQELKAADSEFPQEAIEKVGYSSVWQGQKSWNGVAILARDVKPVVTRTALPGDSSDTQARYIEAAVKGVLVTSLYAPNGNPQPGPKFSYKLAWLKRLSAHGSSMMPMCRSCWQATSTLYPPTSISIRPNPTSRMPWFSRKAGPYFGKSLSRAGWMQFARFIRMSLCTPFGTTCETAGRAMRDFGSTICS